MDFDYTSWATISATSAMSGFPASNATLSRRSQVWRPGGNFTVTSSNNLIYINDGSDKTVTLTAGNYTYDTLAAHIQTQLLASSTLWTCTYDFSGSTFKFTIARSSSGTLRFSQTTSAAWDMLGFTLTSDLAGTSFPAQEIRCHTSERYEFSLGAAQVPTFLGVVGPLGEAFTPTNGASLKLLGNGMPVWTAPALSETVTKTDRGIHHFVANTSAYEYFAFELIDRTNPGGPNAFKFGRIWLGEYTALTFHDVARGFGKTKADKSDVLTSETGVRIFNQRAKYRQLSALEIMQLDQTDRLAVERIFEQLGVGESFFLSIDPTLTLTPTQDDLTIYGNFDGEPKLKHIIYTYYSMSFDFREAV
jgi:hypothetical protein